MMNARTNRRVRTGSLRWIGSGIRYGFVTLYLDGIPLYGLMTYELDQMEGFPGMKGWAEPIRRPRY